MGHQKAEKKGTPDRRLGGVRAGWAGGEPPCSRAAPGPGGAVQGGAGRRALTALLSQEHQLEFPQRIPEVSARGHNGAGGGAAADAAHRPLPEGRAEGRPPSPLGPRRAGRRLPGSGAEAERRKEAGGRRRRGGERSAAQRTDSHGSRRRRSRTPECASLWGETGARLPSAGRADVRSCVRACARRRRRLPGFPALPAPPVRLPRASGAARRRRTEFRVGDGRGRSM